MFVTKLATNHLLMLCIKGKTGKNNTERERNIKGKGREDSIIYNYYVLWLRLNPRPKMQKSHEKSALLSIVVHVWIQNLCGFHIHEHFPYGISQIHFHSLVYEFGIDHVTFQHMVGNSHG